MFLNGLIRHLITAPITWGSTMNSNVEDRNNKRKIIRGGSWKDVAYYLEVSTRDFEYADTARSYIGFRTVQSTVGPSINTNN